MITPVPNSRSRIITADGSSDFFLYVERGSLRGQETVDAFYQQLEAGDVNGAYQTFVQNSLVVMRVSDFGWNGLGVPMTNSAGGQVADVYFKVVDGMFTKVDEVSPEDSAEYLELIRTVLIPALEGGSGF